ncbi:MAG: hypothetical protein BroJett011_16810 [Chloroflexota bacterium]|nr:MAG: hypothetical protein BroJett011_16810 [Chloroflexota bacterium]
MPSEQFSGGDSPQSSETGATTAAPPAASTPAGEEINLQVLAYKVYLLLKQELKLEQERFGRSGLRRF